VGSVFNWPTFFIEKYMYKLYFVFIPIYISLVYNLYADPTLEKGKILAEEICSVCHGINGQANSGGNSVLVPHLTAQNEFYLIEKLKDY
jgi:cytochrome c553